MGDSIELRFETPIQIIGQVSALEAIEHVYSLMTLATTDWRKGFDDIENWQDFFAESPGKLLQPENALYLTHMFPGSAVEIARGLASPVEKLIEFLLLYRQKKRDAQLNEQSQRLRIVMEQLLPVVAKMKKAGVPDDKIQRTIAKAYQFIDHILDEMAESGALTIRNVSGATISAKRCPQCGQPVSAAGR